MEDLFAGLQPTNDGGAGTPPAAEPPTPPVAEPPAPETPPAADAPIEPTPEEKAEIDEWNKVTEDMFPGLAEANKEDENGQPKSEEKPEESGADKGANPPEKSEKKPGESAEEDDENGTGAEEEASGEDSETEPPKIISQRSANSRG